MGKIDKTRYWVGVLYPENMRENWEEEIGDIVQFPYAYCKHTIDKDTKSEHRKDHVHLIVAFSNTTTYKHALDVFDLLSADGKKALNKIEAVNNIRHMYDYLIHDTETCKKQGKEKYAPSERFIGNNFDIGAFEQLGIVEREAIIEELNRVVKEQGFVNFMDLFIYVDDTYEDRHYCEVLRTNSSWYERLTRGNYQRWERSQGRFPSHEFEGKMSTEMSTTPTENTTDFEIICCRNCGSVDLQKNGKTKAGSQVWRCKSCGKRFVFMDI